MERLENDFIILDTSPFSASVHSVFLKEAGRCVTLVLPLEVDHGKDPSYSGNTIFPFAGRIKDAHFGDTELDRNDGANSLHGGFASKNAIFSLEKKTSSSIVWALSRKAGEDRLEAERTYRCAYTLDGHDLIIDLSMDSDIPVLCDMTVHIYFNLSGEENILNHTLQMDAESVVINDRDHCPLSVMSVDGTIFDLRKPTRLEKTVKSPLLAFSEGLNNAYILDEGGQVRLSAGGITVEGSSDSKAVVVYSGGYLESPSSHIALEFEDIPFSSTRTVTDHFHRRIRFSFQCK